MDALRHRRSNHGRKSHGVEVGKVLIGNGEPVRIQAMTDTDTSDHEATACQAAQLIEAGAELVRITVDRDEAALAVPVIRERLFEMGMDQPLIGDFHYNGHDLLKRFPSMARALDKYRINPGNVGFGRHRDDRFAQIIDCALEHERPVRIGVNWGSLDQRLLQELMDRNARESEPSSAKTVMYKALAQSAILSAEAANRRGMGNDKIILSVKLSDPLGLIRVNEDLAGQSDHALHLGLTEAGMGRPAIVASSAALSPLLLQGIGDTIRISLTPRPGQDRCEEVRVARDLLQSIGMRAFSPRISACPGCGRTTSSKFRNLADDIQKIVDQRMIAWNGKYQGVENLKIAVMGCIVNGPGESQHANVGISLPGTGEEPIAPVFVDGKKYATLRGKALTKNFVDIIDDYVETHFSKVNDLKKIKPKSTKPNQKEPSVSPTHSIIRGP